MPIVIPINYDLALEHGVNAAIVHQQITHWVAHEDMMRRSAHRRGWFTGTAEQLTELCPLTTKQIRTAMAVLIASGLMRKAQFRSRYGDQTCSYQPVGYAPKPLDSADAPEGKSVAPEGNSPSAPEGGCTSPTRAKTKTPPNPPDGGDDDGRLFDSDPPPPSQPKRRRRKANRGPVIVHPPFDAWYDRFPKHQGRAKAREAWIEHEAAGADMTVFERALDNYELARMIWSEANDGLTAPSVAPLVFLNGEWEDFESQAIPKPGWDKSVPPTNDGAGQNPGADWQAAHAIAADAYRESSRTGTPLADLLAGQSERSVAAALKTRSAWKSQSATEAKFVFKAAWDAWSPTPAAAAGA